MVYDRMQFMDDVGVTMLTTTFFSACLLESITATDVHLPMSASAVTDLLNILEDPDSYTYLTLNDDLYIETVKVRNVQGTLVMERGLGGTVATAHPCSVTQVASVSPTVVAVVKDLICNYSCCETPDCACTPVHFAGSVLPNGNQNVAWEGAVVFNGDAPITIGVSIVPDWMTVTQIGNFLKLTGTPTGVGVYKISVAATNCAGTAVVPVSLEFTVSE